MLLLAACGSPPALPLTGAGPTPKAVATPKPDLVARLDDLPQGVVRLHLDPATRHVVAHVDAQGLVPATAHAVQLRRGTCLQRGGVLVTAFADALSGSSGLLNADVRATSSTGGAIPAGVHLELYLTAAALLGAQATPLACADIAADSPTAAVGLYPTPGFRPYGTASLVYRAASASASIGVALQELVGSSVHAVQILAGPCAAPGALLHPAGDVVADAGGAVSTTQVVGGLSAAPPRSGWIVVVRYGPTSAIGTAAKPSPQAQPILCGTLAPPP